MGTNLFREFHNMNPTQFAANIVSVVQRPGAGGVDQAETVNFPERDRRERAERSRRRQIQTSRYNPSAGVSPPLLPLLLL